MYFVNYAYMVILVGWPDPVLGGGCQTDFSFLLLLLWDGNNSQWEEFHLLITLQRSSQWKHITIRNCMQNNCMSVVSPNFNLPLFRVSSPFYSIHRPPFRSLTNIRDTLLIFPFILWLQVEHYCWTRCFDVSKSKWIAWRALLLVVCVCLE